jgi:hypothetical protein
VGLTGDDWPPDGLDASSETLWWLCRDAHERLADPDLRAQVAQVRDRLGEPLRLAVAGAVSAGKSTLVNALLGRRVAPADAGECTRMVAWYAYGEDDGRVEVELLDGTVHLRRLDADGRLPADVGMPPERVRRLVVHLAVPALRTVTIIDTPGMNTVSTENEERTRRLLFGEQRQGEVQALLYVLRYTQRFDAGALAEFRSLFEACGLSAVNTVALLSHVDLRVDEPDPWPRARSLAGRAYQQLSSVVFDVVPVVGLLAEAARSAALTGADLVALRELAAADPLDLDDALLTVDDFLASTDLTMPAADRRRLVERLHLYGLRAAAEVLRAEPDLDLAGLSGRLAALAGYREVLGTLDHFARRAGQLKALGAIADLRRLSHAPAGPADRRVLAGIGDALDEGRPVQAGLSGLRVLAAFDAARRGVLRLDDALLRQLERMVRGAGPADQLGLPPQAPREAVTEAARQASGAWRQVATTAGGSLAGTRARGVLDHLEELAAGVVGWPPVEVRPAALSAAGLAGLSEPDRRAAAALGADRLAGQVGAPADASAELIAMRAARLAARFRGRAQSLPPAGGRRALVAVCDAFETIWTVASGSADD